MKMLNIGCGADYRKNWVNLDYGNQWKCDVNFDLNKIYDGEKLPFKDRTFDEIILFDVLEHFPEPLPILREIYRICKIGGLIKIKVPEGKWVWDNMDHKHQFSKMSFKSPIFRYYCSSGHKDLEIVYIHRYILPTRHWIFSIARWIFKRNLNICYRRLQ